MDGLMKTELDRRLDAYLRGAQDALKLVREASELAETRAFTDDRGFEVLAGVELTEPLDDTPAHKLIRGFVNLNEKMRRNHPGVPYMLSASHPNGAWLLQALAVEDGID